MLINSFKISSNQLQRARPWALNINRWSLSLYVRNAGEPYANCASPLALCPLCWCFRFLPTEEKPPDPFRQAIALLIDTSSPIPWIFAALCWHRYVCHVPGLHKRMGGHRWETEGVCKVTDMEMSARPSLCLHIAHATNYKLWHYIHIQLSLGIIGGWA